MKSFKNLFIKDENDGQEQVQTPVEKHGFPVGGPSDVPQPKKPAASSSPFLDEIIEVYQKGLESINMPGYDFFDFYNAIQAAGSHNDAVYKMAFQMGKTMDAGITSQKLISDAEYYISKINEVYRSYSEQGRAKLDSLDAQLKTDKDKLAMEASHVESEINRLKQQIVALEKKLSETRAGLGKVDHDYTPKKDSIQQRLVANDEAMQMCVQKLNSVKEGILKYLK